MAEPRTLEETEILNFPQQAAPAPARGPSLTNVYSAIATVLAIRFQCLALLIAAMVMGGLVIDDPTPLRLWAGAGYGLFTLAALALITRVGVR